MEWYASSRRHLWLFSRVACAIWKEAGAIRALLKDNCLATYHIGSTSIPGMKAKPINDIMPVVQNLEEVEALIPEFEKLGYEFRGEWGLPGRCFFRKEDDARTHYVHIYQVDNHYEIKRHLAFPIILLFANSSS